MGQFYCPRRDDTTRWLAGAGGGMTLYFDPEQQIGATPLADTWRGTDDHLHGIGCSYCGSMRPEAFLEAIKAGAEIGPTDKGYKVYVDLPEPHPDWLTVRSSTRSPDAFPGDWQRSSRKLMKELTERDGVRRDYHAEDWIQLGPRSATRHAKFYLQHIAHPGPLRAELFDLVTAGEIRIGYPGHFYSGLLGIRLEHLSRHPDELTEPQRAALEAFRARNPGIAAP